MNPLEVAAAEAPNAPGVYFFLGDASELLYVGKAGDLRERIRQHARTIPNRDRLHERYRLVREVRWEILSDEDAAATREADLIVALQPRFNALIDTGRWAYILVSPAQNGKESLCFELAQDMRDGARAFDCFPHLGKGVMLRPAIACSDGYTAFLRLLWAASGEGDHMPSRITRSAPHLFETAVDRSLRSSLHSFLSGVSERLLSQLDEAVRRRESYMLPGLERDRSAARGFFGYGPRAIRRLRLRHGLPTGPISRDEIVRRLSSEVVSSVRGQIRDYRASQFHDSTALSGSDPARDPGF